MCGTAQEVMKKNADVEGAEELTKLQDDFYKLEKDVMDAGSATDGQKILAKEIYNKIMELAGKAGLADDIDNYMKMHLDSIEKGDPKPGFGRTDIKEDLDESLLPLFFALWGVGAMVVLPGIIIYDVVNRSNRRGDYLDAKVGKIVGNMVSKFKKDKNYKPTSAEVDASKKLEKEVKSKEPSIFKKAMSILKSIKSKKEEVELDEASARRDAMRAMRKDKGVDPADVDTDATDDDVKAASKNIMMQMRKVISLRGNFKVEFGDKKKMKIDPKIASAVQNKYDSIKRPIEKQKFTIKVAKSYKDMLSALKEGFASDAQRRAAFAQGYKAKGKKGKKENTILDRIDKKVQERKNG